MAEFQIKLEWEEPPHSRTPELNATWARLEIYAGQVPVTKVEDHRSRGVRDGIYVPVYPIAEWMVSNWWFLWHEWRIDRPDSRHNLLSAREGSALPNLSFCPTETRMSLVWKPKAANEFGRVSFLTEGSRLLPKGLVQQELRRFVDAVVQRLDDQGIASTFLSQEWQAVLNAERDPDQRIFCEQSARLGCDPFDPEGSVAGYLEELDRLLPSALIDDFCDAVTLNQIPIGVKVVRDFLASAEERPAAEGNWQKVHADLQILNGLAPWEYGYQQARRLRSYLGVDGPIRADLHTFFCDALDSFDVEPFDAPNGIEAISAPAPSKAPRFGVPNRLVREESKRFVLCRLLSDALAIEQPALVTGTRTEHQQRNRAFAAEFLAPAASLRERLPADHLSEDDLEDLAQEFDVSGFVIRHQIENHQLATIAE